MTESAKALVLLTEGNEEIEAVISIDVMRRAEIDVTVAGVDGTKPIRCSRGVMILPDVALETVSGEFDIVVLPGGAEGAKRLAETPAVGKLLRDQESTGRWVGAICAAPVALKQHGVFEGRRMTSHPSVRALLEDWADYSEHSVVEDGNLITSRGPGTAFAFALRIVGALTDAERMANVRAPMMFPVQVS